jgi:hypothetical protein
MLKPRLFSNLSADAASAAAEDLFNDPITFEQMNDPVVASDGFTYERSTIEDWLRENDNSPTTGSELLTKELIPNNSLKRVLHLMGEDYYAASQELFFDKIFTNKIMVDPVVASDGFTYERDNLLKWFRGGAFDSKTREHRILSPTTGEVLQNRNIIPNLSLKRTINQWMEGVRNEKNFGLFGFKPTSINPVTTRTYKSPFLSKSPLPTLNIDDYRHVKTPNGRGGKKIKTRKRNIRGRTSRRHLHRRTSRRHPHRRTAKK